MTTRMAPIVAHAIRSSTRARADINDLRRGIISGINWSYLELKLGKAEYCEIPPIVTEAAVGLPSNTWRGRSLRFVSFCVSV